MIFVSVGTQLPFDRLIQAVDQWAGDAQAPSIFAQIGEGRYVPKNIAWQRQLSASDFQERLNQASVVVAHAGIGTILSALEIGKPVIVLPRRATLGEHRNEHQLATAHQFQRMGLVTVAETEQQLKERLEDLSSLSGGDCRSKVASQPLIDFIQGFLVSPAISA